MTPDQTSSRTLHLAETIFANHPNDAPVMTPVLAYYVDETKSPEVLFYEGAGKRWWPVHREVGMRIPQSAIRCWVYLPKVAFGEKPGSLSLDDLKELRRRWKTDKQA